MELVEYFGKLSNYPIMFIGSGFSLRYCDNAYTWEQLLERLSEIIYDNTYTFNDDYEALKGENVYLEIAQKQEEDFNNKCRKREADTAEINELWDELLKETSRENMPSKYKLLVATQIRNIKLATGLTPQLKNELESLLQASNNIMSIVTTNYDNIIETLVSDFKKVIGNNILFSTPFGSIYKIHGDIDDNYIKDIILTKEDYNRFKEEYKLIKSHLISLFLHNPIIFIGYSIEDENIQEILRTIFQYVKPNSKEYEKIKENFLVIEWEENSENSIVENHSIRMEKGEMIEIKKLRTDNFSQVYNQISKLQFEANGLEIKKVSRAIFELGKAEKKISIDPDINIDSLSSTTKGFIIREENKKQNYTSKSLVLDYFNIIDTSDTSYSEWNGTVSKNEYFPAIGFSRVINMFAYDQEKKENQITKLRTYYENLKINREFYNDILTSDNIFDSIITSDILESAKHTLMFIAIYEETVPVEELSKYLKEVKAKIGTEIQMTEYRRLISLYDYIKFKEST